jgi:glycosyltransferase involved in cell wall biosynthesis
MRALVSSQEWQPERAVAQACAVVARASDSSHEARVLKNGVRGWVVWLDGLGPEGEAVVVKAFRPRSFWHRLAILAGESPAAAQARAAALLRDAGLGAVEVLAVVNGSSAEQATSYLVCRAVQGARSLAALDLVLRGRERRRVVAALGDYVAQLHQAGIYAPDLKHDNFLVQQSAQGAFRLILVDLDRVRRPIGGVSWRRRVNNLAQLHWGLGWSARPREQLAVLAAYRAGLSERPPRLKDLARRVEDSWRRKYALLYRRRRRAREAQVHRMSVSCMIICQNEAPRIRACLESVKWCDEIVVVDGLSTDGTEQICREYTSRVFERPWPGHRAQKQFALDQTTCPWVLNVDADERVTAALREEIELVLAHDGAGCDGFEIPRLVLYLGRWWRRGGWYPSRRLRLFRRANARWGGRDPHEKVIVRGRIGRLDEPLHHLTYRDVAHHLDAMNRLTDVAARDDPRAPTWSRLVLRPLARFFRSYVLRGGCREGLPGLFVAISGAVYVHMKYAKKSEQWQARVRASAMSRGEEPLHAPRP